MENNELAFSIAEEHFGINPLLKAKEMKKPDKLTLLSYLSLFYELFLDADPALPTSSDEGEVGTIEGAALGSTPGHGEGGRGVRVEVTGSVSEERKDSKKKRRKSFFRRNSKKKMLGASPSSAERYVSLLLLLLFGSYCQFCMYICKRNIMFQDFVHGISYP